MIMKRGATVAFAICLLLAVSAVSANVVLKDVGSTVDVTAGTRKLLKKKHKHKHGNGASTQSNSSGENESGGETDAGGEGGGHFGTVTAASGSSGNCTLSVGGKTTTFAKCFSMGSGTTYFSLSNNVLTAGYQVSSAGWAAMAFGTPHQGASAVFASGSSAQGITMNGFSPSQIAAPSAVKFSNIKVDHSGSQYSVTFSLPWTVSSQTIALATGPGTYQNKQMHYQIPTKYTITSSSITASG